MTGLILGAENTALNIVDKIILMVFLHFGDNNSLNNLLFTIVLL